jgi:hypothetical protein
MFCSGGAPPQQHALTVNDRGFGTVERADGGGDLRRQIRFGEQRELCVEHDPGGAAGDGRRGGVRPDSTASPDGQLQRGVGE